MKEHSLQVRFLLTVLSAMLTITLFVGGFSIFEIDDYIRNQTINLVEVTCENEATKINDTFGDMESSVRIMENFVLSSFVSEADVKDRDKQNQVIQYAEKMFVNVAKNSKDAVSFFLLSNHAYLRIFLPFLRQDL